jgi:hypothetical protein
MTWAQGKGGQAQALNKRNDLTDMLVKSESRKYGHRFTTINRDNFLKLILKRNQNFQEITEPEKACKVYFDVDFSTEKNTYPGTPLNEITEFIQSILADADIQVSGSMTEYKNSYHITLNNYIFRNLDDVYKLKPFAENYQEKYGFDPAVYGKHRAMKCVFQSKDDGRIQNIFPGYDTDARKHLITAFIPDDAKPIMLHHDFNQYAKAKVIKTKENKTVKTSLNWNDIKSVDAIFLNPALTEQLRTTDIYDLENEKQYLTILNIIPNPPFSSPEYHTHNTIWNIMRWAKNHGLSLIDFIKWVKQRDGCNVEPYYHQWKQLNPDYAPVRTNVIRTILEKYYPDIVKDKTMLKFADLQNLNADEYIYKQWLTVQDIQSHKKYVCLHIGMGGNKTGAVIDYLRNTEKSWVWITPRITLGKNTIGRMNQSGIMADFYKDFTAKNVDKMRKSKKLIIQLQSLGKLCVNTYDIVIIDEIESALQAWLALQTHGKNGVKFEENWDTFKNILQQTSKCFLLDAFLSNTTLRLITDIEESKPKEQLTPLQEYFETESTKCYTVIRRHSSVLLPSRNVVVLNDYLTLKHKLIHQLKNGRKVYVFYPYGESGTEDYPSIDTFSNQIISASGLTDEDVLTYWKNTDDRIINELDKVNQAWADKRLIIANSKITVGVNFDMIENAFDDIFLFWVRWINSRDVAQASCRARTITGNIYTANLALKGGTHNDKVRPALCDKDPVFKALYKNLSVEDNAKSWDTFLWFLHEAGYKLTRDEDYIPDMTEVEEMESLNIDFQFNDIEEIHNWEIESLEIESLLEKQMLLQASTDDKLRLQKYYFQAMFKHDTPAEILQSIWETKQIALYKQLHTVLTNPHHLINRVLAENNLTSYQLPDHSLSTFSLSPQLRAELESTFHLRKYFTDSKPGVLIHRVWETFFKTKLFKQTDNDKREVVGKMREIVWVCDDTLQTKEENARKWLIL